MEYSIEDEDETTQPPDLSEATTKSFVLTKYTKTEGRPCSLDLINGNTFTCQGVDGIHVFNTDLEPTRNITLLPRYENYVYDVTLLGDGNIVVAAIDGLFLLSETGDIHQQIAKQRHGSVSRDPSTYDHVVSVIHDTRPLSDQKFCRIMQYQPKLHDPSKRWESIREFNLPCKDSKHRVTVGVTLDAIYVACEQDNVIYGLDKYSGQRLRTIREYGSRVVGVCQAPRVCQSDWTGAFLVCDKDNHRILVYTPHMEGWTVLKVDGLVKHPQCAIYKDGELYVIDSHAYVCVYSSR